MALIDAAANATAGGLIPAELLDVFRAVMLALVGLVGNLVRLAAREVKEMTGEVTAMRREARDMDTRLVVVETVLFPPDTPRRRAMDRFRPEIPGEGEK